MSPKFLRTISVFGLAALCLAACGNDEHEHENPNVEACEHLKEGPSAPLTAAATSSADAPKVSNDHKRYDVTLVDVGGMKGGHVSFAAPAAGDYIFFTGAPMKLVVKSASGAMAEVPAEAPGATTVPECTEVMGRNGYPLQVGTYVIALGPAAVDKVSIVIEAAHAH